jgi:hypothetical protein
MNCCGISATSLILSAIVYVYRCQSIAHEQGATRPDPAGRDRATATWKMEDIADDVALCPLT